MVNKHGHMKYMNIHLQYASSHCIIKGIGEYAKRILVQIFYGSTSGGDNISTINFLTYEFRRLMTTCVRRVGRSKIRSFPFQHNFRFLLYCWVLLPSNGSRLMAFHMDNTTCDQRHFCITLIQSTGWCFPCCMFQKWICWGKMNESWQADRSCFDIAYLIFAKYFFQRSSCSKHCQNFSTGTSILLRTRYKNIYFLTAIIESNRIV